MATNRHIAISGCPSMSHLSVDTFFEFGVDHGWSLPGRGHWELGSWELGIDERPARSFPDFHQSWCVAKMATCDECCGFNIKDVETYVKKHDIHYILKDCIIKLCSSRPDNPYRFMREYFENLEKVRFFVCVVRKQTNGERQSAVFEWK